MINFSRSSLSFKLVVLFLLTFFMIFWIFQLSIISKFRKNFRNNINLHSAQYFELLTDKIGSPPNLTVAKKLSQKFNLHIRINGENVNWSSANFPDILDNSNNFRHSRHSNKPYHTINRVDYQARFIFNINHKDNLLLLPSYIAIVLLLIGLYLLIRRMFSPLNVIKHSINRIGAGELDHRININRRDELGELALAINNMADDINDILESKRQLLLAISHELRSPLTRSKVAISLLDGEQKQLIANLDKDLNEMETLIKDILETEQLNQRQQVLTKTSLDINKLIKSHITTFFAEDRIVQELDIKVTAKLLDEVRMRFVINNLLKNALQYRKQDSDSIKISSQQTKGSLIIKIIDNGVGIATEHIPHLTEQFYRVDKSRQRKTGGFGMGLYIVKMIVQAHGGKLQITSEVNVGTTVTVILPNL